MIKLNKDWKIYSNSIRERCQDLIQLKIWNGIELDTFHAWRNNFNSDEEIYFSACVLDSLVYRSNSQTFSLIDDLLYRNIANLFRNLKNDKFLDFPHCLIGKKMDPLIRLIPAITSSDPVTKSSNEILRFMKRYFRINEKWIANPWKINEEISKGVSCFIFIDDFMGTGHQLDTVIQDAKISQAFNKSLVIYAPLVAHEDGIKLINAKYPDLKISPVETLTAQSHSFFKNYFPNEVDNARQFYIDMISQRKFKFTHDNKFGFGNLELTYCFEHATPNNSLQILYAGFDNWNPLFKR
jgi:hypothetical protein